MQNFDTENQSDYENIEIKLNENTNFVASIDINSKELDAMWFEASHTQDFPSITGRSSFADGKVIIEIDDLTLELDPAEINVKQGLLAQEIGETDEAYAKRKDFTLPRQVWVPSINEYGVVHLYKLEDNEWRVEFASQLLTKEEYTHLDYGKFVIPTDEHVDLVLANSPGAEVVGTLKDMTLARVFSEQHGRKVFRFLDEDNLANIKDPSIHASGSVVVMRFKKSQDEYYPGLWALYAERTTGISHSPLPIIMSEKTEIKAYIRE